MKIYERLVILESVNSSRKGSVCEERGAAADGRSFARVEKSLFTKLIETMMEQREPLVPWN